MIAPNTELVDLYTPNRELESIMLEEYPGIIKEDQHKIDESDPDAKTYCFYELDKLILLDFLKKYKNTHTYEIRRSGDGEFVEINTLRRNLEN